ncbi:MAG: SagB/ThcOx family dehydrogenase [Gammaproteobacteria bacterium]|nr:SagB/ThcOx family dehydrogenase [Gammaproteobacteria bacterium]
MPEHPALHDLPEPRLAGAHPLERLLAQRRCVRSFANAALSLAELGQLLWAAQGITDPEGLRTAPSAGALYPLELYSVVGAVDGLEAGIYRYRPEGHQLKQTAAGDRRGPLARAALGQSWLGDAAVVIALAAVLERTSRKYGRRAERYVPMEVGHAGQNLFLQAEALDLAAAVVGAFDDGEVATVLGLPAGAQPLSLMPVGKKRQRP